MRIFVDSDVVIASLLSSSGAAYLLLHTKSLELFISSVSQKELEMVVERLHIEKKKLDEILESTLQITPLLKLLPDIKETFEKFVLDIDDAHIIAGTKASQANFLITYNVKA